MLNSDKVLCTLATLTVKQLKAVAKALNADEHFPSLKGYSKLRKSDLVNLLTLILGDKLQTELTCEVKLPKALPTTTTVGQSLAKQDAPTTTKKAQYLAAVKAAPMASLRLKDDPSLDAKPTRSRHGNMAPCSASKRQMPSPTLDRGVSSPRQQRLKNLIKEAAVRAALDSVTVGMTLATVGARSVASSCALAYEAGNSLRGHINKLENTGKFLGVL